MTKTVSPRILESHDYISLVTPNGRFTSNRSGYKISGEMSQVPGLFDKLVAFTDKEVDKRGGTFGKAFAKLSDPKVLSKLYPNWNKVVKNPMKPGIKVKFKDDRLNSKYGMLVVKKLVGSGNNVDMVAIKTKVNIRASYTMLDIVK